VAVCISSLSAAARELDKFAKNLICNDVYLKGRVLSSDTVYAVCIEVADIWYYSLKREKYIMCYNVGR
jgi:hypothetical protein